MLKCKMFDCMCSGFVLKNGVFILVNTIESKLESVAHFERINYSQCHSSGDFIT